MPDRDIIVAFEPVPIRVPAGTLHAKPGALIA